MILNSRQQLIRLFATAVFLATCSVTVHAQQPPVPPPAAAPPAQEQAPPQPETEDKPTTPVTLDDEIDFNLNNADINAVIAFITKYTGKPVVKEKSVNAKLTISSPEEIPAYRALDLIYDSLRLEGFAVIETEQLIQIVPAADTVKYDILNFTGELPEKVARQEGMVIRKIVPLANVRATAMKAQLDPLLGKHANIAADERTNKLIITDTVRNIKRYESIVRELDIIGFDNMEVRIVPLKHGNAAKMAEILKESVVKAASGGGAAAPGAEAKGEPAIAIIPDSRTNSLVITSPVEKISSIVSFIERMDVPEPADMSVHVVTIEFAEAEDIARAVSDIFSKMPGRTEQDTITVRATGRDNRLLILASEENIKLVEDVISTLDTESSQKKETRRYELEHLDAEDTAEELTKLYGDVQQSNNRNPFFYYYSFQRGGDDDEVKFVPIVRTNSLLVVAPPSEFELIESLIEEIDQPVDPNQVLPKIYRIRYAQASDVEEVLDTIFGEESSSSSSPYWNYWRSDDDNESSVGRLTGKVKFSSDDNTNSVIAITNNPANYEIVDRLIEQLDTTMPELANTMVVNLEHANAEIMAAELNSLFGKPVQPQRTRQDEEEEAREEYFSFWWGADTSRDDDERPISNLIEQVRFVPDPRTNSILITTSAQNFDVIRNLIEKLDNEEPQVLIKVRIIEVQKDKDKRIGLRWTPAPGTFSPEDLENSVLALSSLDFIDTFGGENGGPISSGSNTLIGRDFSQTLNSGRGIITSGVNLNLLLQLLVKNLDAEIVISPTLYVSNNEVGHLFVGENIPRLEGSQLTAEGTRNDTFQNEDIGITMEITPNISRIGQVVLNVNLTTAQRTGQTRFGSDVLQKREYNTKVAVNNGDTMVLGGIRMSTDQQIVRKVPLLGDLPLVGKIFQNRMDTNAVTDLYAFITPYIISESGQANEAAEEIRLSIGAVPEQLEDELEEKKEP